jgi:hypothetical protein
MQSASDVFLGWLQGRHGRDYFARQLRDMKFSVAIHELSPARLSTYAGMRVDLAPPTPVGDAATISGYLGKSDAFDQAIGTFALSSADQTARDHAALVAAVRAGRIEALVEENL